MKAKPKKKKNFLIPSVLFGGSVSTVFQAGIEYEVERMEGNKVILRHSDKNDTSRYQFNFEEVTLIP